MQRVLIVDDNEVLRASIRRVLSKTDLQVCGEAQNGAEALQMAVERRPDIILLDISMPGLDGLETSRRLRTLPVSPKIVILSNHDVRQFRTAALQAGASGCLDKSRLLNELLPTLHAL